MLRLGVDGLHAESDHERRIRDAEAAAPAQPRWDTDADVMEIGATLEALALEPRHRVLELGAGRGRFTRLLAERSGLVVAVDISVESLRVSARTLTGGTVALVEADATRDVAAPAGFDRALGTLASNLPTREAREASYRAAARALVDDGVFVFSTHYYGVRARLEGEPKAGRYTSDGIYRYLLTPAEVSREVSPYFESVRVRPICVVLPFSRRLGLPVPTVDRVARRVPLLRAFGGLLLVEAKRPRR